MVSHAIFYDILFPPYIVDNIEPDGRIDRPDGHQIHVDALYTYIADMWPVGGTEATRRRWNWPYCCMITITWCGHEVHIMHPLPPTTSNNRWYGHNNRRIWPSGLIELIAYILIYNSKLYDNTSLFIKNILYVPAPAPPGDVGHWHQNQNAAVKSTKMQQSNQSTRCQTLPQTFQVYHKEGFVYGMPRVSYDHIRRCYC